MVQRQALRQGAVDADHGDDPQPRDDDDRRAARPLGRAGQLGLRPRLRGRARPRPARATCGPTPSSSGQPRRAAHRRPCSARSTSTASSAPAPRRAGSRRRCIPVSGHAPDEFTINAAMAMVEDLDPHLMFVNLGDIDRYGHTDFTGPLGGQGAAPARAGQDRHLRRPVRRPCSSRAARGATRCSIVLADHSMDWSTTGNVGQPGRRRSTEDPLLRGRVADRRQRRRRPPLLDRSRPRRRSEAVDG